MMKRLLGVLACVVAGFAAPVILPVVLAVPLSASLPLAAWASEAEIRLDAAPIDVRDVASLQAGARTVRIDGAERAVRCEVRSISGFSAHADESELVDWLRHFAAASRWISRSRTLHSSLTSPRMWLSKGSPGQGRGQRSSKR